MNISKRVAKRFIQAGFPLSTMYALVDNHDIVQAKGSAKAMQALKKKHPGWVVWNSPTSQVGDVCKNPPPRPVEKMGVEYSPEGILEFAGKLAKLVNGSRPKHIGAYRFLQKNESALFTTISPDGVDVVVVVSVFEENGELALGFFTDEHLSELNRFENISSFTYGDNVRELREMARDIKWVWQTADRNKASWEEGMGTDE